MSGEPFGRLVALVRRASDSDRPLRVAEVVDVAGWSATGAATILVRVLGAVRTAIYRDGPAPAVGAAVQVVLMGPDSAAPYLALPLPQSCAGMLYASVRAVADGTWRIVRLDTALGTWQQVAASPVAASWDRAPLHQERGLYLYTWGSSADWATPGPLYRSADNGATWAACGIDVATVGMRQQYSALFACGGADVFVSHDEGASWASIGGPGGTVYDVIAATGTGVYAAAALADGGYFVAPNFNWGGGWAWQGPYTPGGRGTIVADGLTATWTLLDAGETYTHTWNQPTPPAGGMLAGTFDPATYGAGALHNVRGTAAHSLPQLAGEVAYSNTLATWPLDLHTGDAPYCEFAVLADGADTQLWRTAYDAAYVQSPWARADGRLVADLGGAYRFSADGLAVMQWWEYNYGWLGGTDTSHKP